MQKDDFYTFLQYLQETSPLDSIRGGWCSDEQRVGKIDQTMEIRNIRNDKT